MVMRSASSACFERVFALDDLHATRRDLRFGAVDIERRESAEFQRSLIAFVCDFSCVHGATRDLQISLRFDHRPVLPHRLQNVVAHFGGEIGARLLQIAASDHQRRLICE